MKKVLCVKKTLHCFNVGEWYNVTEESDTSYILYCDNIYGGGWEYLKTDDKFITNKEYRKLKLNRLNNDKN